MVTNTVCDRCALIIDLEKPWTRIAVEGFGAMDKSHGQIRHCDLCMYCSANFREFVGGGGTFSRVDDK